MVTPYTASPEQFTYLFGSIHLPPVRNKTIMLYQTGGCG
jgi:hypothetical protein